MANQIVVSAGAKVRNLQDVIIGTSGVLTSLGFDVANGVPRLDVNGKILVSQLPNSVMEYKGTWNISTNTPTLVNGTGNQGDVYLVEGAAVGGTAFNFGAGPITFFNGDQAIYSGTIWQRASGATGTVTSVAVTETGDSLNITGSPITTSGTINIGFNGTNLQYVNGAGNLTTFPTLITSIGLSMPSAFSVANSPLTANGTIAVTGAGYASQYIRGDGTLADFPSSGGGGSSVSYYLNGGTSQGTIGGVTYYEMSKTADTGTGVDFAKSGDGFIVAFLTDANDPAQLNIPAGNWNYEIYASMSSNGGTPQMYAELYVYDGTTFTLISTSSNEIIYDGTALNLYTFAMAVPATTLTLTDRLAVKLYATNSGGKTTTIHTQDSHLCQIITTFSTGITALNGLTAQVQYFQVGTSGTDFNISSTTATHTFNIPDASATARGLITTGTQTIAGTKTFSDATKNNGGIFLQNASSNSLAGYMNIGGLTNGVKFTSGGGVSNTFTLPSATGYTFTFPNATGTIALTSDIPSLTGYVPYTGATGDVNLGLYSLTSNAIKVIGDNSTYGGTLSIKQSNVTNLIGVGYTELFGKTNRLGISFGAGSIAYLSNSTLTAERTYTLPDATGTIALVGGSGVGTVTSVAALTIGTSGTDLSSSVANSTTTPVITLNVPTASATNRGALSSADWTTFNNKQSALTNPVTGTGTTNYLPKFTGASTIGDSIVQDSGGVLSVGGRLSATATDFHSLIVAEGSAQLKLERTTTSTGLMYLGADNVGFKIFDSAFATRLTLTSGGNLGLGVTPSAWGSGAKAIEIAGGSMFSFDSASLFISQNAYFDTSWKYKSNGFASYYYMVSGGHQWLTAPSGTAGAAITFTQAMTLDASGRLGIGTPSPTDLLTLQRNDGRLRFNTTAGTRVMLLGDDFGSGGFMQIYDASGNVKVNFGAGLNYFNGGNLLVGTTTDSGYKLDVNGTSRFSDAVIMATTSGVVSINTTGRPAGVGGGDNGKLWVKQATAGNYGIASIASATDSFTYIAHNGTSAVIGTSYGITGSYTNLLFQTSDATRLTIASTGAATFTANSTTLNVNTSTRVLEVTGKNSYYATQIIGGTGTGTSYGLSVNAGTNSSDIAFQVYNQTETAIRLLVRGDGNVGIGTSSPANKLQVTGTAGNIVTDIDNGCIFNLNGGAITTANNGVSIQFSRSGDQLAYIGAARENGTDSSGFLSFATQKSDGTHPERMRITSGGQVSIGTSGTVYGTNLLNVNGGIYATSSIAAVVAADIDMLAFVNTGATYSKACVVASMTATGGTGSYFFYGQQSTSTAAIKIFSNGNIQNTNNSYGAISDARLKENIKDATPKLDDLMKVKVRNYNLKGESNKQLGVISQELEAIFPNMIEESTNMGENMKIKGVKYSVFVPMLIKAVQEQQQQINELKQLINK